MLGNIATTCLTFQGTVKLFPKWPHHFSFSSAMYEGSTSSTKPVLYFFFFFGSSHPSGCEVVLLCVILMTNDGECLSYACWPFVGFPDGSVVKNPLANAGDMGSIPGLGRSPGKGNGNPLQCSCLRNPIDR